MGYFGHINNLWKAQKLVREAEKLADKQIKFNDLRVGVHSANGLDSDPMYRIGQYLGFEPPYRIEGDGKYTIKLHEKTYYSWGNEMENNINGKVLSAKEWVEHVKKTKEDNSLVNYASPALMTLKSSKIAMDVLEVDSIIDAWCINSHGPGLLWTAERMNGPGYFWEWVKCIAAILDFKDNTTKPIILTEVGCGEYHWALSPLDVLFLYNIHRLALGERMIGCLFYNDDLFCRLKGYEMMEK